MTDKYEYKGLGLPSVLFMVFLVLKLTGNIDWSWVWVTAPLWIPVGIVLVAILLIMIWWGIDALVK